MDVNNRLLQKPKQLLREKGLYDPRLLALAVVSFVAVSVFWNGSKIIQQNFELSQRAETIKQENIVLQLENQNKKLQNQFMESDEFVELIARRVYGKAAPDEKVYIVPTDVALNSLSTPEEKPDSKVRQKPKYQQNLEAWITLYFGS